MYSCAAGCDRGRPAQRLGLQVEAPMRAGRDRLLKRMLRDVANTSPMNGEEFAVRGFWVLSLEPLRQDLTP